MQFEEANALLDKGYLAFVSGYEEAPCRRLDAHARLPREDGAPSGETTRRHRHRRACGGRQPIFE